MMNSFSSKLVLLMLAIWSLSSFNLDYVESAIISKNDEELKKKSSDQFYVSERDIRTAKPLDEIKYLGRKLPANELLESNSAYSADGIKSFDVGNEHICVINVKNKVLCWGTSDFGQLGMGSTASYPDPKSVTAVDLGEGRVPKEIHLGYKNSCVLLESDDLLCWGYNQFGQLCIGSKVNVGITPQSLGNNLQISKVGTGRKVKKVALGWYHSCAILDDNTLKCWGHGNNSQLGLGDLAQRGDSPSSIGDKLPIVDFGGGNIKDVSVGIRHTCIILESNEGKCWGYNLVGQLGQKHKTNLGKPWTIPMIDVGGPIIDLQAGNMITCALLEDKGVKCFGQGYSGTNLMGNNLPYINLGTKNIKKLLVNADSPCALTEDDELKCWGNNGLCSLGMERSGTLTGEAPVVNLGGRTITDLKGYEQRCTILSDGTFTCWGGGQNRGCAPGDMGNNLPHISLACTENSLSVEVTTESYSDHTSIGLNHVSAGTLVMKSREGYYSMENKVYTHDYCVPDGTFEAKIEHSIGNWSGSYEINFKGNLIAQQNPAGYFWKDRYVFSSCSSDIHCDDGFSCTSDTCNLISSQCDFTASFSDECRSYGSPLALVIRSVTSDSNTTSSLEELSSRFFGAGNSFSMRSQFLNCSYDKFDIVPFTGRSLTNVDITNGTIDIMIEETSFQKAASTISSKILEKAENKLGTLSSQFDFIIICLPPGVIVGDSAHWKAYAFVDGYISIYNDLNCIYPSVQMHELGHNLGLSHSNDEENYGDTSGMMGISYTMLDGPAKCFNAPKSLKLQWYVDGDLTLSLKDLIGKEVHLVGITDYQEKGFKSTHLKIINCENGYDYFLSFNRQTTMNSGTSEGKDQILVTRRRVGSYYDDSKLIAKLEHLQKYTIYGLGPKGDWDLQIMPNIYLEESPSYGRISFTALSQQCLAEENCNDDNYCTLDDCTISNGELICLHIPVDCSDCGSPLHLEVITNDYPLEILWDIRNINTNRIVKSSSYYTNAFSSYNFSECFEFGMYIFSIYYTNSTNEFYNNATFKLSIGDEELDSGNITELIYAETIFTICSKNSDCLDYDGCTVDFCDTQTRLCNNSFIPLNEDCVGCFWAYFNLTTDNFAEETKWNVYDQETGLLVESGDPYPSYFHAFGRRKAPTKAGRRKAPTKSGRRKAPTKSGRRKAPTRSSSLSAVNGVSRYLEEDEDNEIFKAICLEMDTKYKFIITDSFGDGICCAEGEGFYAITLEEKVIKKGGNFSSYEEVSFKFSLSEASCEDNDPGTRYIFDPEINACLYYPVTCDEYGAMTTISIKSDIYADDTIWQVIRNGTIEMEGGMYDLAYSIYESKKCLPFGLYTFSIIDPPADGMAFCFENECGYDLTVNNRTVKKSDGSFGKSMTHLIGICASNEECNDNDTCTVDTCDLENRVCIFDPLSCSECSRETVIINVSTDILFSLTAWKIIEKQGNVTVASAGPFVKSYTNYQKSVCLLPGTYLFVVSNSEGRGMTICKAGLNCGYTVTVNGETVIDSDGSFAYENSHSFIICDSDDDCDDGNSCNIGQCNMDTKLCRFDRLPCSSCDKKGLKIMIDTDSKAAETSWNLQSLQNHKKISSGGKYAKSYTHYVYDECIPKGEYVYSLFDEGGDGFGSCAKNGTTCGYSVAIDGEVVIKNPGKFGSALSHSFKLCDNETICNNVTSTFIPKPSPIPIRSPGHIEYLDIQSFATGFYHTCALTNKHVIYCWGDNNFGQLGYGDKINRPGTGSEFLPVDIGEDTTAKEIHAGAFHTCIVTIEDDIMCWGDNSFGQLGVGSTVNIGSSSGEMGNTLRKTDLGLGRKARQVSLGFQHSCALLDNYIIKCWGNNEFGQLGISNFDTIGDEPFEMGNNLTVVDLGSYEIVQEISVGTYHTCALQLFQVRCWGKNLNGQLGYGDRINRGGTKNSMGTSLPMINVGVNVVKISAGNSVTFVISDNGKSKCFGYNKFGQLGFGDKIERGGTQTNMGDALPFTDIGDDQNITYITRGSYSICALLSYGSVKCWGSNIDCSLGLGDSKDRFSIEDMGNNLTYVDFGDNRILKIEMYHWHGCVLFENSRLSCWGFNRYGQLGNGHYKNIGCNPAEMGVNLFPVNISDPKPWVIRVDSVSTIDFENGIDIEYNVSKSFSTRKFSSYVYDKTCSFKSNNTSIFVDRLSFEQQRYAPLDKAIVTVDVDYRNIRESHLWSDISSSKGAFEFCIVSEMYFDEMKVNVISMSETIISSTVDFDGNFSVTSIQVSKSDVVDVHEGSHFQMKACLCNIHHVCDKEAIIHQDSDILLCVHPHDELRVTKFQTVNFYQDGILKFKAVENGEDKLLTSTSIEGEYGVLETRLIADFFRTPNPSAAHITGEVYLDFRDHITGRYLSENQQASFNLNISLLNESENSTFEYTKFAIVIVIVFIGYMLMKAKQGKKKCSYVLVSDLSDVEVQY